MTEPCKRCIANTKKDTQCKRTKCRYAPFCAAHRAFNVGESTIPGVDKGLFATSNIKQGETLGDYTIATVRQNETDFLQTYPDKRATHTALVNGVYYTAMGTGKRTQNAIGLANRAPSGRRNNARILKSGRVIASRPIAAENEIFLAYGSGFKI